LIVSHVIRTLIVKHRLSLADDAAKEKIRPVLRGRKGGSNYSRMESPSGEKESRKGTGCV
jgi:hypothetical protein